MKMLSVIRINTISPTNSISLFLPIWLDPRYKPEKKTLLLYLNTTQLAKQKGELCCSNLFLSIFSSILILHKPEKNCCLPATTNYS